MALAAYPNALRGIELLKLAEDFYQAYIDLPPRNPPYWPRYFMLCHATELGLKAYLAYHGRTHEQLMQRGVRHNLRRLMSDAVSSGLSVKTETRDLLELLDEAHSRFWPRYPRGHGDPADAGKPVFVIDPHLEMLCASARAFTRPGPITSVHSLHVFAPLVLMAFQALPAACMARWPSSSRIGMDSPS
jgi:hypothetical protein